MDVTKNDKPAKDIGFKHNVISIKENNTQAKDLKGNITEIVVEIDPTEFNTETLDCQNMEQESSGTPSTSKTCSPAVKKWLSENRIQTWKQYRWSCGICFVEHPDLATLRSHSIAEHKKCAEYACFVCQETFNYNSFLLHTRNDHNLLRNCCHYCDAKIEPEDMATHINHHTKPVHICSVCGETFTDDTLLQKHLVLFVQKKKRRRKVKYTVQDRTCPICHKVSWCFSKLRDHMKIHGERQRDYICNLCGKSFFTKATLSCHQRTHSSRAYICDICNKTVTRYSQLKMHMSTHSDVKSFICETCGRSFRLQKMLDKHKIIHTDTFPFSCQYCQKGFNFKACMAKHERQHTGVKPYSCDECGRAFTNWGNYNKHMKRRHNRDMSKKKLRIIQT